MAAEMDVMCGTVLCDRRLLCKFTIAARWVWWPKPRPQGEPPQETAPPLLLLFCFSFSVRNDTTFRPTSGGLLLGPSLQIRKRPFCTRACTPREDYTNGI